MIYSSPSIFRVVHALNDEVPQRRNLEFDDQNEYNVQNYRYLRNNDDRYLNQNYRKTDTTVAPDVPKINNTDKLKNDSKDKNSRRFLKWYSDLIGVSDVQEIQQEESIRTTKQANKINPLMKLVFNTTNLNNLVVENTDERDIFILKVPIKVEGLTKTAHRKKRNTDPTNKVENNESQHTTRNKNPEITLTNKDINVKSPAILKGQTEVEGIVKTNSTYRNNEDSINKVENNKIEHTTRNINQENTSSKDDINVKSPDIIKTSIVIKVESLATNDSSYRNYKDSTNKVENHETEHTTKTTNQEYNTSTIKAETLVKTDTRHKRNTDTMNEVDNATANINEGNTSTIINVKPIQNEDKSSRRFGSLRTTNVIAENPAVLMADKLIKYINESLEEVISTVAMAQKHKDPFLTNKSFYVGYIMANVDVIGAKMKKIRNNIVLNSKLWATDKLFTILDSLKEAAKFVTTLHKSMEAYLQASSQ